MFRKGVSLAVLALATLALVVAQQGPTEAPAGFDTPPHSRKTLDRKVSATVSPNHPVIRLPWIKPVLNNPMMATPGLGPYLTREPAWIVIRTLSAGAPANSQKSGPVIMMPTAIS
jgi:hypothetical protein